MFKNYLKTALRNIKRNKIYAYLNIFGLAVGIAGALVLYLYIRYESSYDTYHEQAENIYRIHTAEPDEDKAVSSYLLAPVLKQEIPEIKNWVRLYHYGNKQLKDERKERDPVSVETLFADSTFFEIFSADFIIGDKKALEQPQSAVLTEEAAIKLYGKVSSAMNQSILIAGKHKATVRAIVKDVPQNSHFHYGVIASMNTLKEYWFEWSKATWAAAGFNTYVLLSENTNTKQVAGRLNNIPQKYMSSELKNEKVSAMTLPLMPLRDIHLHSQLIGEMEKNADILSIYLLVAIAIIIVLVACFNYINLTTARATQRAKEVGIRKVLGSYQTQLMGQFLAESLLMTLFAFILGLVLVEVFLPFFNRMIGQNLYVPYLDGFYIYALFFAFIAFITIAGGLYPAFVLARFRPVSVLKGKAGKHTKGAWLRKSLVVAQFTVSIIMMIATVVIYLQLHYAQTKDLGYSREQVIALDFYSAYDQWDNFRKRLLKHPDVLEIAKSSHMMAVGNSYASDFKVENQGSMENRQFMSVAVDENFNKLMQIQILSGRDFENWKTDMNQAVLVNEAFVKAMGWQIDAEDTKLNPLHKKVHYDFDSTGKATSLAKVVGVVKNYHLGTLKDKIEPMVIQLDRYEAWRTYLKIRPKNIQSTLAYAQEVWEATNSKDSFETHFIEQSYLEQYREEEKQGEIYMLFAGLAILIASLGLFGLVSFSVEQRVKEIGIRKVLGAGVWQILTLISKDFLGLILIALGIAIPVASYWMDLWLDSFAYRIQLLSNWYLFFIIGGVTILMALLTISRQAYRAATINPVKVLKDE